MVKQKKIILVNPTCLDERISGEDASVVPIGLFYIAAQLLENDFDTTILNLANIKETSPLDHFTSIIKDEKPDVVGFSVTNPNRWNAIDCAKIARKILPNSHIVFGGPAPTFITDHMFEVCPELDYIVTGEGEITFLELLLSLENTSNIEDIQGLVFRKKEGLFKTPFRNSIEDLDTLTHPSKFFTYQHLAMSRGCPGKCTFCGSPKFWSDKKVRFHSPLWFANEIEFLVKKGVTHFYISDDTFTMDKNRVLEFCQLVIEKKLSITWNAISRVDYIDDQMLLAMRKAGCIQLSFGVESGSKAIRKTLGKPMDPEKIQKAFTLTTSYGILPRAYFIYGSPGETKETIQQSVELLKAIKPLSAIFYMLVIFPGTHLYYTATQKYHITDEIWHQRIEDLPWFEVDKDLNFSIVKSFGEQLRTQFYSHLETFAKSIYLIDLKELYPFHADFLSRLAMTFSHGEYADNPKIKNPDDTAKFLHKKALSYEQNTRSVLGLAMLHQKDQKFDAAILLLKKGLNLWPENQNLNTCMGVCLMNLKRFKSAIPYFEKFKTSTGIDHYLKICQQHSAGK